MTYSVITACLNSAGTIRRSIDSVLSQKPLPAEYIFVDGGSTDATLEIIRHTGEDAGKGGLPVKIRIISQEEKTGITGAWNLALKEITTDTVFILNSDDWYEPDAASEVEKAFNDTGADIVISSAYFHGSGGKVIRHCRSFNLFPLLMPIVHPGCFVKKSVYDKVGLFDQKYRISADYEFLYRCRSKDVKFHEIRKVLVNMELGGTANSSRSAARSETVEIGRKYSSVMLLPELAYLARWLTGR